MEERPNKPGLKRCFGMREAITITTGTVIGVGLFTVGANVVGILGPAVIFATLAAMLISIYPALLYAEMGAALPYSGGTYQYARRGLGRVWGMLAGWCFIISMVSVASGEALAFSFYLRTLAEAVGFAIPVSDTVLGGGAVLLFLILGICGVEFTGRLQNGFLFFFWGIAVVWGLSVLPCVHFENFMPQAWGMSISGFLPAIAMVWWCFAGFETCCAMGGEIRYPQINLPRAMFLAPFLVFAVNGLFQWMLLALVPGDSLTALADAAAPYAYGMKAAGVVGFPLVMLCMGIAFGGDFSTLNASVSAPARYLYTMARDGVLPRFFGKLHPRFRTPYVALLCLGILIIVLVGTGSIEYIASLSLFATLFYYVIGIFSAWGLRKKEPALKRTYRAPIIWLGAPVSALIYLLMITQLEKSAVIAGMLWCLAGVGIYRVCTRRKHVEAQLEEEFPEEQPEPGEKKRMDREFRIWCVVTAAAAVGIILLFLCSFFAG